MAKYRKEVYIRLDSSSARIPEKKSKGAAAYDVYCPHDVVLEPGKTQVVPLGFRVEIPPGYDLKFLPRSGLSSKGVTIRNAPGTIDPDYRGEMCVILKYEPEDVCHRIDKVYKALSKFCQNLVSSHQFNIDEAKKRLFDQVNVESFKPYMIKSGDRVGQLQLQKIVSFDFVENSYLSETARGEGGFGSTGR